MTSSPTFGTLLRQLRKRAGMTQGDLAAAVGYSVSFVSDLEQNRRLPAVAVVLQQFVPALGLQEETGFAAHLVELAALARGERQPATVTVQRSTQLTITETFTFHTSRLPTPPTELLGREQAVKLLCNRLQGHAGRLLTLVGPPGVGKTRLALAVAAHSQHLYQDGATFIPLAALSDPARVAAELVATLQINDLSQRAPNVKLIEFLRRKELLLVLDNFEQITPAAGLVAELLTECPGLRILVTSRERLHLRAEQRYQVPPLALDVAVKLFTQHAQAVDFAFELTAEQQPIIEAICLRLDCLPLAIELIAARSDLFSPQSMLARLKDRALDLLDDGPSDASVEHRTLRNAIHRSYVLCSAEEQRLFRALGVFVGGFDLAAVVYFGFTEAALQALVHKNLVKVEGRGTDEPRFMLLETLREYALEQLAACAETSLMHERHYMAYLQRFRIADSHLRGLKAATWLVRLKPEQENLRAALHWVFAEARYADAAWLLLAVQWFWFLCGSAYERARWLAQLLPYRQTLAPDLCLATLLGFYTVAYALEEFQPIARYTNEVMQLLEVCSDKLLHASAWFLIGVSASGFSRDAALARDIALVRAAYEGQGIGHEFGSFADRDFVLATHLWGYSAFLIDKGEVARALPLATESLALFRKRGNHYGIGGGLGNLGRLALLQGDLAAAHRHLQEAVTLATTLGYHPLLCEWQPLLGLVTLYRNEATEARRLLMESLDHCLELKNKFYLAAVCTYLAEVDLCVGKIELVEQWLAQSLAYHGLSSITIDQVERVFVAGRLATAQQQYQRAAMLFGAADHLHSQIHYVVAGPIRALADTALATVRAALNPEVFAEAFTAGQQLSLEEAFAKLLTPGHVGV